MFRGVSKGRSTYNNRGAGSYRGGRGRGSSSYSSRLRGGSGAPQQPKGLFADGIWLCNCTPRVPAEHFKVKKEGRNNGRWFYTCQNGEGRRCDFFLWDEDAAPRMAAAVLSNSRNEPRATLVNRARDGPAAGGSLRTNAIEVEDRSPTQSPEPPPPYNSQSECSSRTLTSTASSKKRTLDDTGFEFDENEDEPFPWVLTGQEEAELVQVADRVSQAPETPRKAVKTTAYATPATTSATTTGKRRLPWLDYTNETPASKMLSKSAGLPTPSTTTPSTKSVFAATPDTTPTPSRFRDALTESISRSDLADEVFSMLRSASVILQSNAAAQLKGVLTKHDLRTQGIAKGRDISRLAIKAKDAKIVELQARISALEAERELDRARVRGLRLKDDTLD